MNDADTKVDTTVTHNLVIATKDGYPIAGYSGIDKSTINKIISSFGDYPSIVFSMDVVVTTIAVDTTTVDITPCPYTHAHTSNWCGHAQCRDS